MQNWYFYGLEGAGWRLSLEGFGVICAQPEMDLLATISGDMMQIAMIQDEILALKDVDSAYMDRGTFFGDGVYEVVRSYGGRIFALDDHLERFSRSLTGIDIAGVEIEDVRARVLRAFERADIADAKIYFHITRGSEIRDHAGGGELEPNFFLTVTHAPECEAEKRDGIGVSTYPDLRWKRCDIKSLNLLANVLARRDAAKKGCAEAILVSDAGQITEGAASALFMVPEGCDVVVTRPLGPEILGSITRQVVLKLAAEAGIAVVERAITPEDAKGAAELFIAVTTKDIVPVVRFDGEVIADGKVGRHTRALMEQFVRLVSG